MMPNIQPQVRRFLQRATDHVDSRTLSVLVLASATAVGLDGIRVAFTHQWKWLFLTWNLALAWLPFGFALAACHYASAPPVRRWRAVASSACWLLFFPNALYIFTDLVHLGQSHYRLFWLDMILILLFATTGLVLGFVSLYLMHGQVAQRFGWVMGWLFITLAAGMSGVGVFIGRFLRWNSWDAFLNPLDLIHQTLIAPGPLPTSRLKFSLLFGIFAFLSYLMLYALTHLKPVMPATAPRQTEAAAR